MQLGTKLLDLLLQRFVGCKLKGPSTGRRLRALRWYLARKTLQFAMPPNTSTCCSGGRRFGQGLYFAGGMPFGEPVSSLGNFALNGLRGRLTGSLDVKAALNAE
jgi:hypothetical protein